MAMSAINQQGCPFERLVTFQGRFLPATYFGFAGAFGAVIRFQKFDLDSGWNFQLEVKPLARLEFDLARLDRFRGTLHDQRPGWTIWSFADSRIRNCYLAFCLG